MPPFGTVVDAGERPATSPSPLRTRLAGLSMVAGGALIAVRPFLGPANLTDNTRERLDYLAAHPGPTTAKALVFQAAVLLVLPGIVAVLGRVRGRGSFTVLSGGVVYVAGLVGFFSFILVEALQVSVARSGPVTDDVVRATEAGGEAAVAVPTLVLALLCFHLVGLPWLTLGLARADLLPWSVAALATVATLAAFFGSGTWVESLGWMLTGLSLALVATVVLFPGRSRGESSSNSQTASLPIPKTNGSRGVGSTGSPSPRHDDQSR